MASHLLSLPREVRNSRPTLSRGCSYQPQATRTDFLSVISEIVIVDDQPFHLHKPISGNGNDALSLRTTKTSAAGSGLSATCKQLNLEYSSLIQKAAFTPGSKIIAPVYDFNFQELTKYIKTLRPHEIRVVNANELLVVKLYIFATTLSAEAAESLLEWIRCCDRLKIEFTYVVEWTQIDTSHFQNMKSAIDGTIEGKKILNAIGSRNVKAWSWEGYQAELKKEEEARSP